MTIPVVPPLPDTERRTSYTLTNELGPFDVNFDIYGDGIDYTNWVEVWLDNQLVTSGWILTSATGQLARISRPITDAQVTFESRQTGVLEIVGARRPRRLAQLTESQGVPARVVNQYLSDTWASMRETWDKLPRAVVAPPGEALGTLPQAADRALTVLGFDSEGAVQLYDLNSLGGGGSGGGGTGNVTGPGGITGTKVAGFNGSGSMIRVYQGTGLSVLGRSTSSTGDVDDIVAGGDCDVLRRSGGTLGFGLIDISMCVTGDLPFANMAQIATARILGRTTSGTGDIEALTGTQTTALLNNVVGDTGSGGTKGRVPAPGAGDAAADKFLKANGTWSTTPVIATGTALTVGTDTNITLTLAGAPTTALVTATSITPQWVGQLSVSRGGTGASTLTGLLQGSGTSAVTAITNSSTVGQVLRVTGAATYGWGAVNLSDTGAVTGDLPLTNIEQIATARILGRTTASTGDIEVLTSTQATALLNNVVGDSGSGGTKGLVPAPGAGDGAAGKFLKADGTWATTPSIGAGAALTRTNDANVTLTFGGAPTTALVTATSIAVNWAGTLAVDRGGSGAGTLTGLLQGNGTSAFTVITNSTTVGQCLRVTGSNTYGWGALDLSATDAVTGTLAAGRGGTGSGTYTIGDILYASGATTLSKLADAATGNALIAGGVATAPSWGKVGLTTHVSGTLAVGSGGTGQTTLTNHGVLIGAATSGITVLSAAAAGTLLAGVASSDPAFTATPTLGVAGTTKGTLALAGNTSGTVTIQPAAAAGTWTLTLPTDDGTADQFLKTNGSGVCSWASSVTVDTTLRADGKQLYYDSGTGTHKYCWASPKDSVVDLRDFMDLQYGAGAWSYRSAHGAGSDAAAALEAALAAVRANYGGYGSVRITGGGIFRFTRSISAAALNGIMIEGVHPNSSQLCFEMENGYALTWDGGVAEGIARTGGGLRNIELFLDSVSGGSTASMILCEGNTTKQPSSMVFENISTGILGTQNWYNGFIVNGVLRTSPSGSRDSTVKNFYIFNCRNIGAEFANAVLWTVEMLNTSNGSATGMNVYITGGGTGTTNTTSCKFSRFYFNGDLIIDNCYDVELTGRCATIWASTTAVGCYGFIRGALGSVFGAGSITLIA